MNLRDRMFGRPQGLLGRVGAWLMELGNDEVAAWVLDLANVRRGDRVLDIGCGGGVGLELAARRIDGGFVAGVDPSALMVERALARNREHVAAGRMEILRGQARSLPWEAGTFDKVLAMNSAQLWENRAAALAEAHRVLREGGTIALSFSRHAGTRGEGMADALTRAGFRRARRLTGKPGACVLATA